DLAAAVLLGVFEGRLDDPVGAEHRDRLDRDAGLVTGGGVELVREEGARRLDLLGPLLELDPRIEVLRVLTDDHDVSLRKARANALVRLARADARVEVELLAEGDVDR